MHRLLARAAIYDLSHRSSQWQELDEAKAGPEIGGALGDPAGPTCHRRKLDRAGEELFCDARGGRGRARGRLLAKMDHDALAGNGG